MDKTELLIRLKIHIINSDKSEILTIYYIILKNNITDRDVLLDMMAYFYKEKDFVKYMNLLRLFGQTAKNNSEIAYFVSFYFLMKKSYYHALLSFQMVEESESPFYSKLAGFNIESIEKNELMLLNIIKSEKGEKEGRIKSIEENIYKAVSSMIEYAKNKDIFRDLK